MKAVERRLHEQGLGIWERLLRDVVRMGPLSESAEDLDGFGEVKDYISERIDAVRRVLEVTA
ncbi:MAG: hypothetical protein ABIQ36_01080 [Rhodanobacter sp.]